jgi:hypothetical protein
MSGISVDVVKSIVLQLIGGSPIKSATKHVVENLKTMHRIGGGLGSTIPGIGSISAITDVIKNPISDISNQARGAITGAVAGLTSFPTLSSTLSGAIPHLFNLQYTADRLSGAVLPNVGEFGIHDAIQLASSAASGVNLTTLTASLNSQSLITTLSAQATQLSSQVIAGSVTEAAAIAAIQPTIDQIHGIVTSTQTAFVSASAAVTTDMHLNQMLSHLADSNSPAEVKNLISSVIQPSKLAAITAATTQQGF